MLLDLPGALTVMAEAMTAVNASRRQVSGIAAWRDQITAMTCLRDEAERVLGEAVRARFLRAEIPGAGTHRDWRTSAEAVTAVLAANQDEAARLAGAAEDREQAAERDAETAREGERHAWHMARTTVNEGDAALWAEAAQACAAEAGAADQRAYAERGVSTACREWQEAAGSARARGRALVRREDQIHIPVGEAIAAGGGRNWIAAGKDFLEDQ
jgi:hypothetical protein